MSGFSPKRDCGSKTKDKTKNEGEKGKRREKTAVPPSAKDVADTIIYYCTRYKRERAEQIEPLHTNGAKLLVLYMYIMLYTYSKNRAAEGNNRTTEAQKKTPSR